VLAGAPRELIQALGGTYEVVCCAVHADLGQTLRALLPSRSEVGPLAGVQVDLLASRRVGLWGLKCDVLAHASGHFHANFVFTKQ